MLRIRYQALGSFANGSPSISLDAGQDKCKIDLRADPTPNSGDIKLDTDAVDDGAVGTDDGITIIDLSDGCPLTEGGTVTGDFPTNIPVAGGGRKWTAAALNNLKIDFEATRLDNNARPLVKVDGAELIVNYAGRPSPAYPGGCDPKNNGVQFIFGDLSRMRWLQSDVYLELCGGLQLPRVDDRAIAIYGLHHGPNVTPDPLNMNEVGPVPDAELYDSGLYDTSPTWNGLGIRAATAVIPAGTSTWNPPAATFGSPTSDGVDWWENDEDTNTLSTGGSSFGSMAWTNGDQAKLKFRLPTNVVPPGSVIEHAEVRVRHAEPKVTGVIWADTWSTTQSGKLKVYPGGNPDESWPSGDPGRTATSTPFFPLNMNYDDSVGSVTGAADFAALPGTGPYATNRWTNFTSINPLTDADRSRWTQVIGDNEPELLASLQTAAAWNGAQIELLFDPAGNGQKYVFVDAVEVFLQYRPPGEPRPLRGCMTIRTVMDPTTWQMRGTYPLNFGSPPLNATDQSYGEGANTQDSGNCAFFTAVSKSRAEGTKLHVAGVVYVPTTAVELSGVDNEAPFVTDGIIVRHLSATRWKEGPEIAAFGEGETHDIRNRQVTLTATVSGSSIPVATADVEFDDGHGQTGRLGQRVDVLSWRRRP